MSEGSSTSHVGRRGRSACTDGTKVNSARWRAMRDGTFGKHKRRRKESQHAQEPALGEFSAMISSEQVVDVGDKAFKEKESYYREIQFNYQEDPDSDTEDDSEGNEQDNDNVDDNLVQGYNISTQTSEILGNYIDEGDAIFECCHCGALFWFNERCKNDNTANEARILSLCCSKGKIVLPSLKPPPPLIYTLFFHKNVLASKKFHENIRQYNNMFSFTFMGGKIDHGKNKGRAPYSFVLYGVNHHRIGTLLPRAGKGPVYSQLYIYDTENELANRISAVSKHNKKSDIDPSIVELIKSQLDAVNPFVKQYRMVASLIRQKTHSPVRLCLIGSRQTDGRLYNTPTASEVAILVVGDIDNSFSVRDIIIEENSGELHRINELHASYLPLQYPLLFCYGEDGYRDDIPHMNQDNNKEHTEKMVSMREFFAYRLMTRKNECSTVLHASRLLQQFIVDGYTMIESQRLFWYRCHQKTLRVDLYQGLSDALSRGERNASVLGRRIILPSSFTGGARYMMQNYLDAMAVCRKMGYPDLFLTFTCNPAWPEIKRFCQTHVVKSSDRTDVLARMFKLKVASLMRVIKEQRIFGTIVADVQTIEFKKRGLPHTHILLWLDEASKLRTPQDIDKVICAEIPNEIDEPLLLKFVTRYMLHGPCNRAVGDGGCMQGKFCSKKFPKHFSSHTTIDNEGYPTYCRRDNGRIIIKQGIPLDNRYVVPYNRTLLMLFDAHINVEKCNQSTAIKYLFKYVSKGSDRAIAAIVSTERNTDKDKEVDEIKQYYSCRYLSACEASWRIFGFDIHKRHPAVQRLSFHLPDKQSVIYSNDDDVEEILNRPRIRESQFLSWFDTNQKNEFARSLTYVEFPKHFVFDRVLRRWKPRQGGKSIGRISHVSPSSGELYFLRILLNVVKGPTCFDDLKTFNGETHETFKDACIARGLLDDDAEYIAAIKDASFWAMGPSLRKLFVSMLLCSSLSEPAHVWNLTKDILSEDMLYDKNIASFSHVTIPREVKENAALNEIDSLLRQNGKSLQDFPSLPQPSMLSQFDSSNFLVLQELDYDREFLARESLKLVSSLNDEQRIVYDKIMLMVEESVGGFFFVYGYGGTGKTFLWNALISTIRARGEIVLPVASSGIAATLLPSGRTAHSRFAIPVQISETSVCSIFHGSPLASLLMVTKLIIWDEAPMVQRFCIEAFDRTLRDIMNCDEPFGGKCVVMGGDFRQILPVMPRGSRAHIVDSCINSSYLWTSCKIFSLKTNMRLQSASSLEERSKMSTFAQWLLSIGDGTIGNGLDGFNEIEIPFNLLLPQSLSPVLSISEATYPSLLEHLDDNTYFTDRAILAPTLDLVHEINDFMCSLLPGESMTFSSSDSISRSSDDAEILGSIYSTEFLNNLSFSGIPPHKLTLKIGTPIMLLRNIDQGSGLCNGTRLRVTHLSQTVIGAVTLNGTKPNEKVLLHRVNMNPSETRWPLQMQRRQFPVIVSFAMTINKSQGQSLKQVGLYLPKPVFTHGQLYVALSRVKSVDGLKILIPYLDDASSRTTLNIVYPEIFRNING